MKRSTGVSLFKRIENEIKFYYTSTVELSEGVQFSQYKTIKRIYKYKSRDLTGTKINDDLSYNYWFDIIKPRLDSAVKNIRFDTKHILAFSKNPSKDFPAVFLTNAMLRSWLMDNGEDTKLKETVEEFCGNGNVIFKKVKGGYETVDPLNTIVTNQTAKTIDDTNLVERHEMTASDLKRMDAWDSDKVDKVIKELGHTNFKASENSTDIESSSKYYEIYEYTGEVSELEFNQLEDDSATGDEHNYFLAKVIVAGLTEGGSGEKIVLFKEKLGDKKMSDYYKDAHYGEYQGRFWRVGVYEMLFDYQVFANELLNDLSHGLNWTSKVIFVTSDTSVMQNIRTDLDNGDILPAGEDMRQLDVRLHNMDQIKAAWDTVNQEADKITSSFEVVRGESMPSGTPFRSTVLLDQNSAKLFVHLRQKLTLPFRAVFREWVMPELVKHLRGEDVFNFIGEEQIMDQLREIIVNNWYMQNLVRIGYHTNEQAEAIKAQKLDELRQAEPVVKNMDEIWKGVLPRMFITITGENSDLADNVQDMVALMNLEQDPERIAYLLDSIYKIRGIPVPPKKEQAPAEPQFQEQQLQAQQLNQEQPEVNTQQAPLQAIAG